MDSKLESVGPTSTSVLAIDGHSLLYRAYFALPDTIRDPGGRPVNAIHGFVSMLTRLINQQRPNAIVVAFDSPWPTLRHKAFPAYKANRTALPDALLAQVPLLQKLLGRIGVPAFAFPGYEGDDILASLACTCAHQRLSILIVTGDRDLFQLVRDPWIRVLYTRRGVGDAQILDESGVEQLVHVPPARYVDLVALRGDPADNIAGVPGVGDKNAQAVIGCAGSFEELYDNLECLPKHLRAKLLAGRETLFANRDLLRPIAPIPVNWDAQRLSLSINAAEAAEAFKELGLARTCEALLSAHSRLQSPMRTADAPSSASSRDLIRHANRICLVSCSAEKMDSKARAEDLYISDLFKKSRSWAEVAADRWYILSAKHGLVPPNACLRPYDTSLKDASPRQREMWGDRVVSELKKVALPSDLIYLFAGSTGDVPFAVER